MKPTYRKNAKNARPDFNKLMQADSMKQKQETSVDETVSEEAATAEIIDIQSEHHKAPLTSLMFYKQYDTYQGLMSVWSENNIAVDKVFGKVILHIISWLRRRIGDELLDTAEEVSCLKNEYPEPETYQKFSIKDVENIEIGAALNIKTLYWEEENAWCFRLEEPDNNNEQKNVVGRVFITNVLVKKCEKDVALIVKTTCKEPMNNLEDATIYRPGFVKEIFEDQELQIGELGISQEYKFDKKAICINGKSSTECNQLYEQLIDAEKRQMPIIFVDEDYYKSNKEEVDRKARSFLGFAHLVVIEKSYNKLFASNMQNGEYVDAMNDKQIIYHEDCRLLDLGCGPKYFDQEEKAVLSDLANVVKKSTLRKDFHYDEYEFYNNVYQRYSRKIISENSISDQANENIELKSKVKKLNEIINEKNRDAALLQKKVDEYERNIQEKEKQVNSYFVENIALTKENEKLKDQLTDEKDRQKKQNLLAQVYTDVSSRNESERYMPLINLLFVDKSSKEDILKWIEDNYSEELVIHPRAKKSFMDDSRHIDMNRFCLMIHYLSGYTKYRNDGGIAINPNAAREYDPCNKAYTVTPVSSGHGSTEMYKNAYTIDISTFSKSEDDVILEWHIKYGSGRDADMIRIYFYYSSDIKKSIIGYMPEHLPVRGLNT